MAKDEIKPYNIEDLALLVKERNYHKLLWEESERNKKVQQLKLDKLAEDEAEHYRKFQEYENKILNMAKNLKG